MLIQFDTNESFKFKNSIDNIKKPTFIVTNLTLYKSIKQMNLSEGSKKMMLIPNAGGNSLISEIVSYEIIRTSFNAKFLNTEMEIEYYPFWFKNN